MTEQMRIAEVIVDVHARDVDRPFHYKVIGPALQTVDVGTRVIVPFGQRRVEGYVVGFADQADVAKLKEIVDVLDPEPPLTKELVQLADWISYRYLASKAASVQALLPAGIRAKTSVRLSVGKAPTTGISQKEQEVLTYIDQQEAVLKDHLLKEHPGWRTMLKSLTTRGILQEKHEVAQGVQTLFISTVSCNLSDADFARVMEQIPVRAFKQREVAEWIRLHGPSVPLKDVIRSARTTYSTVKSLVEKGVLVMGKEEERRDPYANRFMGALEQPLPLTEEQSKVYQEIEQTLMIAKPQQILLQGVTGSGKTEVYLQAIASCVQKGKQAIVLVPEISLTPQMVERFKLRFGDAVAVLHSRLSQGERYDEWKRIRRGEVSIVVGARSAIFAPFLQIGLIVIDEEHELSYKQEDQPKYHAREVAWQRALQHGAVLLLGSATPSLETRYAVENGQIRLLMLPHRVNMRALPKVTVVDMREELQAGNRAMFSRKLHQMIAERLEKKEQMILFLNRRGHSTFILCRNCGYVAQCPNCEVSLTYHNAGGFEHLRCHYCGHSEPSVHKCPACASPHIRSFGTGTQRVEDELHKIFPTARVVRMDVDTTGTKGSHERLLRQFREGNADILLGTQMIAKGLDFPRVSLVGVITADTSLNLPDFRAAERTFQLLTQVAGRAGRHEIEGSVVIQTYYPDHYAVEFATTQDYQEFYEKEIVIRQTLQNPPFCGMTLFTSQHSQESKADQLIRGLEKHLRSKLETMPQVEVMTSCPAPLAKLQGKYRFHLTVKYNDFDQVQPVLNEAYLAYSRAAREQEGVITVDVNVQMLL